jgi:hypothetical protein
MGPSAEIRREAEELRVVQKAKNNFPAIPPAKNKRQMNTSIVEAMPAEELAEITGGNPFAGIAIAATAYVTLLTKIEQNPQDYTFLMDWYYD